MCIPAQAKPMPFEPAQHAPSGGQAMASPLAAKQSAPNPAPVHQTERPPANTDPRVIDFGKLAEIFTRGGQQGAGDVW